MTQIFKIVILFCLIGFLFSHKFFYYASSVSMLPTLDKGDLVFVNPFVKSFKRGDIIVFKKENDIYLKRIIALSEESISLKDHKVYINRTPLSLTHHQSVIAEFLPEWPGIKLDQFQENNWQIWQDFTNQAGSFFKSKELQDHEYFVLGDNRQYSEDSRFFGSIKSNQILGVVKDKILNLKFYLPWFKDSDDYWSLKFFFQHLN